MVENNQYFIPLFYYEFMEYKTRRTASTTIRKTKPRQVQSCTWRGEKAVVILQGLLLFYFVLYLAQNVGCHVLAANSKGNGKCQGQAVPNALHKCLD